MITLSYEASLKGDTAACLNQKESTQEVAAIKKSCLTLFFCVQNPFTRSLRFYVNVIASHSVPFVDGSSTSPDPAASKFQMSTKRLTLIKKCLHSYLRLITNQISLLKLTRNSYLCLATWLIPFSYNVFLSYFPLFPESYSLVVPPFLSTLLLTNQHFIRAL